MSSSHEQQYTSPRLFLFLLSTCVGLEFLGHAVAIVSVRRVCWPVCHSTYTVYLVPQRLWVLVSLLSCSTCCLFGCSMGWVLMVLVCIFPSGWFISFLITGMKYVAKAAQGEGLFLVHNWRYGSSRQGCGGEGSCGSRSVRQLFILHPLSGSRERWRMGVCARLPLSAVWDSSPLKGATHIQSWSPSSVKPLQKHPQTWPEVCSRGDSLSQMKLIDHHTDSVEYLFVCSVATGSSQKKLT